MVLSMSRPQLHPRTRTYWLRKRVPADLVAVVGRKEVTLSLGTKDQAEAKRRYVVELSKLEAQWETLRNGPLSLTEREAHEIAGALHDRWLSRYRDEPSAQTFWPVDVGARVFTRRAWDQSLSPVENLTAAEPAFARLLQLEQWCSAAADEELLARGLRTDPDGHRKVAKAIGAAVQRASLTLQRMAKGELLADPPPPISALPARSSAHKPLQSASESKTGKVVDTAARVTLSGLVEKWWLEAEKAGKSPSTRESYTNTMRNLGAFLKHDNATQVTFEDVIAFKDHRLASTGRSGKPISSRTVKNSDLAGLKSVFGWAVANRLLSENPALGVTVQSGARVRMRDPSFTTEEATAILRAALDHPRGTELAQTYAAKRWVPWLLAFTGARVGEIVQMRRQDLRKVKIEGHPGDTWVLTITPEAGTVKTKQAREVPLHPQLIDLGFAAFVENSSDERFFLVPDAKGGVAGPLQGVKNRLGEFARKQVSDPGVSPNHGWRHRFRSVAIEAGVPEMVIDAICGWAPRNVGGRYGSVLQKPRADAIARLPWIKLSANETQLTSD
ncbi:hypothetical protein HCU64_22400 [Methylobacterium sp. C25]|uniref:DUF6538 domain-containing protein n=1 Tax=Methylobacterium sp. C25 TaxID=2721622 RepID=UPI001F178041|nr:DUF6538 domain-containing protein [Methylobacterium sp. C25]MCE4226502.1 hypothetical protein [Methylobacterium sp. C25]